MLVDLQPARYTLVKSKGERHMPKKAFRGTDFDDDQAKQNATFNPFLLMVGVMGGITIIGLAAITIHNAWKNPEKVKKAAACIATALCYCKRNRGTEAEHHNFATSEQLIK